MWEIHINSNKSKSHLNALFEYMSPNNWQVTRFFMFLIQTEIKEILILRHWDKCPTWCLAKRKRKCVFLSRGRMQHVLWPWKSFLWQWGLSEWHLSPFQCWTRYNLSFPHLNPIVIEMKSNYYLMLLKILLLNVHNQAYFLTRKTSL